MITAIALSIATVYGYSLAFTMNTPNLLSAVLFKIIPFIMATVALLAQILVNLEWLKSFA